MQNVQHGVTYVGFNARKLDLAMMDTIVEHSELIATTSGSLVRNGTTQHIAVF